MTHPALITFLAHRRDEALQFMKTSIVNQACSRPRLDAGQQHFTFRTRGNTGNQD
jgi:hypothetical protein